MNDADGNEVTETFITPEFGIDSQSDTLHVFGSAEADTFDLRTDGDLVYVAQQNGVTFSITNGQRADTLAADQLIVETFDGDDMVFAGDVASDLLKILVVAGNGADTLVGSPFSDVLDSGMGDDTVTGGRGVDQFFDLAQYHNGQQYYHQISQDSLAAKARSLLPADDTACLHKVYHQHLPARCQSNSRCRRCGLETWTRRRAMRAA